MPHPCNDVNTAVIHCHQKYGKLGEDCLREELAQKKCYSELLCRQEARRFYQEKKVPLNNKWLPSIVIQRNQHEKNSDMDKEAILRSSKVSCSTIVEVFAKPENEMLIPEGIEKEDRLYCRRITQELATCLSKKRR